MRRLRFLLFAFPFFSSLLGGDSPALTLANERLPSPAAVGARAPALATAADGTLHLVWIERAPDGKEELLRHASRTRAARVWSEPHTVARALRVAHHDNTIHLIVTDAGTVAVLWLERAPAKSESSPARALLCFSLDRGRTWSEAEPLQLTGSPIRAVTLSAFAQDRVMAAWIARDQASGNDRLYARIFAVESTPGLEAVVDDSVFPDELPALTAFPDGSAAIAYRSIDHALNVRRFHGGAWQAPALVEHSGVPLAPAVKRSTGATLTASDGRAAVAWLSFAENAARLVVATSSNAAQSFFMPVRVDDDHPLGTPSVAVLRDRSLYVTWLENHPARTPSLWLRRISPEGELSIPVLIEEAGEKKSQLSSPRLVLTKEYDDSTAQLLIAYTLATGGVSQLVTRLLTLPPAESFTTGRPCLTCPPSGDSLPGFAIKGRIVQLDQNRLVATVQHEGIPGMRAANTEEFPVDAATFRALRVDTDLFARIEQREGAWRLFDVRTPASRP